ncbi:MAG: ACT domain-containing protein [Candidatus Brocadiae bacterium]|nr:ACT domain-containing protein [Candidatus Brocadiia bacterium]
MRVENQLAVFLENKPGTLARVCEALAQKDINLVALTVSDTVDHAVVRIVVDKPSEALSMLEDAGMLVVESDVLVVEVPNRPGALADVARRLADNDVNIEYAYGTASEGQPSGNLIFRTSDPQHAVQVLTQE